MKISPASSDIYIQPIGDGLFDLVESLQPSSIFLLADTNTASACLPAVIRVLPELKVIVINAGEENKTLASCQHIWQFLLDQKADRNALLLNLGGGMITDLGGFAGACYQRGIRFAHVPTSVLGMADAAIGGKTGINFSDYKNYIGTITHPEFIWIDKAFLSTLPDSEKISGVSEMLKHGIIGDKELWNSMEGFEIFPHNALTDLLHKNALVKLKVTETDPLEKGFRKVLNFGHTIGHALESHSLNSGNVQKHGICIAYGMIAEAKMANMTGLLNNQDFNSIVKRVERLLTNVQFPFPTFAGIEPLVRMDKKSKDQQTGFSLPSEIGSCHWDVIVRADVVKESYDWMKHAATDPKRFDN